MTLTLYDVPDDAERRSPPVAPRLGRDDRRQNAAFLFVAPRASESA